jgi:hypothetical protein
VGVDVARAVALVMIVGAHVLLFSTDDGDPTSAYVRGSEGAALFAVPAGVGVGLAYGRRPPAGARAWVGAATALTVRAAALALTVRAVALVALGLTLGSVVDYGEHAIVVLMTFGLLFLLAIALLRLGPLALAVLAAVLAVVVPLVTELLWPLAAAGSLTLTLYTLHLPTLTWFPGAWGEPLTFVAHVAAGLVLAPLWLTVFRRGPVETAVRRLEAVAVRAVVPPPRS